MWQLEYWRSVLAVLMVLSLPIYDHRTIVWSIFDQIPRFLEREKTLVKTATLWDKLFHVCRDVLTVLFGKLVNL